MDLTLTEEQELIVSAAREFLEARCPLSQVRSVHEEPAGYSSELWKEMVDLGWMGLALPEDRGGAGASFLELCLVIEQMGRCQVPSPFVPTIVLCALPIAQYGTDAQRQMWLSALCQGEKIMSYSPAASRDGWSIADSELVADRQDASYKLNGTASLVPYAHVADALLLAAQRRDTSAGELTLFLIEANTPGVRTVPVETVGADRRAHLELTDVVVPVDAVLGGVDDARPIMASIAAHGAAALCAEMVGGAERVLEMTVGYAKEREQFGRSVGSFQAVQHHCANMAMDVLSSRFAAYEAIWRLAEGLAADDEVSIAKAWVSDAYRRVCALGHQVHGAIGFTREHDLQLFFRHAMAAELTFGDGDFHRELLAQRLGLDPGPR